LPKLPSPTCLELNPRSGELLRSTVSLDSTKLDAVLQAGPVRCAAADHEYIHLATTSDDKQLKVWAIDNLELLSERCASCSSRSQVHSQMSKTPESSLKNRLKSYLRVLARQSSSQTNSVTSLGASDTYHNELSSSCPRHACISPKSYPLSPIPTITQALPSPAEADALTSHENSSGGTLILGHTSLLTAFLLTPEESHIITADRDEHIRASWFPQGYMIESFCLGHKK
jgi:tRNA (guanine-N(7)-)-methyltransferase subunit TRM82